MTPTEQVLAALRKASEYECSREGWRGVYLDNARPAGMNDKSFRSCLSALSKQGLYRPIDDKHWGEVKS